MEYSPESKLYLLTDNFCLEDLSANEQLEAKHGIDHSEGANQIEHSQACAVLRVRFGHRHDASTQLVEVFCLLVRTL
jgi:hypothetical protein